MIDYPKFTKMQNMFERKNVLTSYGKVVVDIKTHYICECSRCKCCYQKQNHKRTNVPRERTKEEQKYYKLGGGEIKENNGRHHTTIIEGTYYKWRFFYINGRMEHNMAWYTQYYISIKIPKLLEFVIS